jgi:hypothetical protein
MLYARLPPGREKMTCVSVANSLGVYLSMAQTFYCGSLAYSRVLLPSSPIIILRSMMMI